MKKPLNKTSRRNFLKLASLGTAGVFAMPAFIRAADGLPGHPKPRKLRIGLIGTGGRGRNMCRDQITLGEEIVAMCDVDPVRGMSGGKYIKEVFPQVRQYQDYRKMLEKELGNIDAVIVTTPDHMHAPISMHAMALGLHVFCEKPLTRSIAEARRMSELASKKGVVTQMGSQHCASNAIRREIDLLRAGVIGDVTDIYIWCDRTPTLFHDRKPMSEGLLWDVWCGVTPKIPYDGRIHPGRWRWWTGYGTGALGDMGCHATNAAFFGLDLFAPEKIDVEAGKPDAEGIFPKSSRLTYHFPANANRKALKMHWSDGKLMPKDPILEEWGVLEQFKKVNGTDKIIVGTKGVIYSDRYIKFKGDKKFSGTMNHEACKAIPQKTPYAKSQGTVGHYAEWIDACKGSGRTFSGFDVAAKQTEMILVGVLGQILGKSITWDPEKMAIPGMPEADQYIDPPYRSDFKI